MAAQPITLASEPPAEIKALIDKVLEGFNSKDSELYKSAFGGVDDPTPGTSALGAMARKP